MDLRRSSRAAVSALTFLAASAVAEDASATPMRSWTPGAGNSVFKHASVCHDVTRDVYVVSAVFQRTGPAPYHLVTDSLYVLRVQGRSTAGDYGELVGTPALLRTEARIDHVDCASDDANNVFVTLDRWNANALWYRVDGASTYGPYAVSGNGCNNTATHRPRIAYGNGRVFLAFEGYNYTNESASCEVCTRQYNATSGTAYATVGGSTIWLDNMVHSDYDVEWNDADRFVLALPYHLDAGTNHLSTFMFAATGAWTEQNFLQSFATTPSPAYPEKTRIVYSKNANNSPARMFVQTDTASYWLTTGGARVGNILANDVGTRFALSEYWGADAAVATLLTPSVVGRYVGVFPNGYFVLDRTTNRAHFGLASAPAYESWSFNDDFAPEACEAANTTSDKELFVVSRPATGTTASVFWNVESAD